MEAVEKKRKKRIAKDSNYRTTILSTRVTALLDAKLLKLSLAMRQIGNKNFSKSDALNYVLSKHIDKMIVDIEGQQKLFNTGEC